MAKIYYSGSILGVPEEDLELPVKIVQFLLKEGHEVLSKNVAFPSNYTNADGTKIKLPQAILDMQPIPTGEELHKAIRKIDTECVDSAEYIIALINGPSHGVGMEVERALLREERGLPAAQILCLAQERNKNKISPMIRGVDRDIYRNFDIFLYTDFEDIKVKLKSFVR